MSRRLRFLLTPPAIMLLAHLYVGQRLALVWPDSTWRLVSLVLITFMYLSITAGFLIRHDQSTRFNDAVSWVAFSLLGLFSWLFVLSLVRDVVLVGRWAATHWVGFSTHAYTAFTIYSALTVVILSLLATAIGFLHARRTPRIVHITIHLPHLAPALKGFSLAQITDLHVGPTIKKNFVEKVVKATNALGADTIVLTGDLIDGDVAGLAEHTQVLAKLDAPLGVYAVTGNHEYYSGADQWIAEYRRLGMHVLQNEHVVIPIADQCLVLAGVTDYDAKRFDPQQASDPYAAIANSPEHAAAKILLAHQPRSMWAAAQAGFDVQLSGHTHGGQFWPWGYFVPLQQPLVAGLHQYKNLQIYISRGTGYWGPPLRLGARAEITYIQLC